MSEIKDIVRIRKYEQNGEEKTAFDPIGILITKANGKQSVKLHILDDWFPVVERRAKNESAGQAPDEQSSVEPF
jgi:hypothetical protein